MLKLPGAFSKFAKASRDPNERLPQGKAPLGSLSWGKLDTKDGAVWQAKLDGAFMYYTLDSDGIKAYSWRRSKRDGQPIEHTEKIHGLDGAKVPRHLQGAVLQGEAWDPGRTASEVGAVLNTRKQPRLGELRAALHGIASLPGIDPNNLSNREQMRMLKRIAKELGVFDVPDTAYTPEQKREMMKAIQAGDHPQTSEGVVVYPSQGKPAKAVVRPTIDVPVVGFTEGLGQFKGEGIGSLLVGSSDAPSRVGTGFTEDQRRAIYQKPDLLKGLVAKVEVKEVFPSGKFRGASFKGFHPEKSDPDAFARFDEAMQSAGFSKAAELREKLGSDTLRRLKSRSAAIRHINQMADLSSNIDIEVEAGEYRKPTDSEPFPFDYGEVTNLINANDGDPWDVFIAPGSSLKDDLKVVGYLRARKSRGNDKLILSDQGKMTSSQQKDFYDKFKENERALQSKGVTPWLHDPVFFKGAATEEFAPGIPASREIQPLPEQLSQALWEIAIQEHLADKAGKHYDLRLGDPETGHAHSWALPKAQLPDEEKRMRLAVQQPTHTMEYMDFEGEIPEGYGKGQVSLPVRGQTPVDLSPGRIQFEVPGEGTFVLRQKDDKQWMLLKKGSGVLTNKPGEFAKQASAIRPLVAALLGVPIAGAAVGLAQHPQDPLKAMSGGAIGAATGAGAGAATGLGLMALMQYLGKTGLRPKGLAVGAGLGALAGARLGAREGSQAPVGVTGAERDRILAQILQEMQRKNTPQHTPWEPDLLR